MQPKSQKSQYHGGGSSRGFCCASSLKPLPVLLLLRCATIATISWLDAQESRIPNVINPSPKLATYTLKAVHISGQGVVEQPSLGSPVVRTQSSETLEPGRLEHLASNSDLQNLNQQP